jgi:SAM-dependent methyltransferase
MTDNGSQEHRPCEICGSRERRPIYRQNFTPLDDGSTFTGYDVVVCAECGHGYADGIPDQAFYDRYYRDMSKYEVSAALPANAVDASHPNYADVVAALEPHFPDRSVRILDVGTGMAHLLGAFKRAGYENLLGVDPSPQSAIGAMERYGVRVVATPISQMAFAGERFDLVLLTSVIEHLRDAISSLREVAALVTPGGAICVDAPDASSFAKYVAAPFQQFSLEHINYFSAPSLENAFGRIGYAAETIWTDVRHDGPIPEQALSGLFRASAASRPLMRDHVTEPALRDYVESSRKIEEELAKPIEALRGANQPVIVWGVGTLTLRLLARGAFRGLNIAAFVDSNKNYQGKSVNGVSILAPTALAARCEAILVCSRAHQREIVRQIRDELMLTNPVQTLFSEPAE